MKWLKDLFTDDDGDFDIVILMSTVTLLYFLTISTYNVAWLKKDFDYVQFATGASALIVALGGAYALKRKPKQS